MKAILASLILTAVSLTCLAAAPEAIREVLLDNEAVEVVRLTYPVGSESGMHTHVHPNRVAYVVSGGILEMVPEDRSQATQSVEVADGQAIYLPAATHNIRNIGETEVVIIEVELK
jgi:mannose-6-phosphate isomerase-like protein (cupin superfamily)